MKCLILYVTLMAGLVPIPAAKYHGEQAPHEDRTQSHKDNTSEASLPSVIVHKTVNGQPAEETSAAKKNDSPKEAHDWIDKLNAVSTVVIALFTILLAFGVAVQIRTARNSE